MSERKTIQVLGIAGSLREASYNRALLRTARDMAPEGMEIKIFERLDEIPLYNEDVRKQGEPDVVRELKEMIQQSDALLIVTPEYCHSIPGVLKNAIDWASRPHNGTPLGGKPVAFMGASTSNFGTVRAQMHLRQVCVETNMLPLNKPEVLIGNASERFKGGTLVHKESRGFVRQNLENLYDWSLRLAKEGKQAD
jgi:chromate reductase